MARVLDANGWNAKREFYYNDAGVQIENLALSTQARIKGIAPDQDGWPEGGYRGEYIADVARAYMAGASVDLEGSIVVGAKDPDDMQAIRRFAVAYLRNEQNLDLAAFGVDFDIYFLESSLYADGKVAEAVAKLQASGHTYEEGGALWLRSTDFGDDKDRVMRKSDGTFTYFVPDVAYHLSKWQRGYERAITELGADHHGSLARVRAGLQALEVGIPQGWPEYVLHQMVTVMRGGEEVKLSKRAGSYFTLRDLIEEAGRDATRWFLIARKPDSQLTFDIDLARQQSNDNPVFYVQYAHARVCSLLRQAQEKGLVYEQGDGLANLGRLADDASLLLMNEISRYPEVVEAAGVALEPHLVAQYLRELAHAFHTWYHGTPVLVDDAADRNAKLTLACAARQVLANGLELLGVSAPEKCKHQETQYTWQHDAAKARHDATAAARAHPDGCGWWPVAIAAVVFLAAPNLFKGDGDGFLRAGPQPNPNAQPAPVADADSDVGGQPAAPPATPKPAEAEKPAATQYDFYTLLPGKEVEMSDAELAASARAEDQRRAKAEASRAQAALEGKPVPPASTAPRQPPASPAPHRRPPPAARCRHR